MRQKQQRAAGEGGSRKGVYLVLGILTAAMVAVWWPGCRRYPPVTSPEALRLIKQLYTACNTRHDGRLTAVEAELHRLAQQGLLGQREEAAFRSIVELARSGKWERAERESLRLAQDQLRRGTRR
jgi:hypothetical protein